MSNVKVLFLEPRTAVRHQSGFRGLEASTARSHATTVCHAAAKEKRMCRSREPAYLRWEGVQTVNSDCTGPIVLQTRSRHIIQAPIALDTGKRRWRSTSGSQKEEYDPADDTVYRQTPKFHDINLLQPVDMVLPCTHRGFLDKISPDETTTHHAVVAVDHYLNFVCPSGESIHEILNVSNTTPELLLEFLSHQHYLHILTATLLFLINRMRSTDTASFPILLSHLGLVMRLLRQNLLQMQQTGAIIDDAAIMTIALLTVYAQRLDYHNSSAQYKEQLLQMICSRGGLDASGFCARLKCTLMPDGRIVVNNLRSS